MIALANEFNVITNNYHREIVNLHFNNNNQENEDNQETFRDIMFDHKMKDAISSILKLQFFSFVFFMFAILWIKWQLSFYLPLIFLWIIDIYNIITDIIQLSSQQKYLILELWFPKFLSKAAKKSIK